MQFYFRQFAGDEHVMAMSLDAVGAHIILMCAAGASESGYRLAYDLAQIRNRLRCPTEFDFQRIMVELLAGAWKISADKKWIEQDGMRRTLQKQKEFSKKQSENAAKRWHPSGINLASTKPCSSSTTTSSSSNINTPLPPKGGRTGKKPKAAKYVEFNPLHFLTNNPRALEAMQSWVEFKTASGTPCLLNSYQAQFEEFSSNPELFVKLVARAIRNGWKGLNEQIAFEQTGPIGGNGFKTREQLERDDFDAIMARGLEKAKAQGLK